VFSKFFIDRPIFASVLSIVITLAGGISLYNLPLTLYPPIAPPTVRVSCMYPGASAQDVSDAVATPIEEKVNGVENMLYMSSQCTNDGTYSLTVTFRHGTDLKMAQVMVQNRVSLALPLLPDVLKQTGVDVRKQAPDILLVIALNSPTDEYDQLYLSNYGALQIVDELGRLPGISEARMFSSREYSMRIWVDPERLAARGMQGGDVVRAIREQNLSVATGQIGQQPAPEGQAYQVPLSTLGRLSDVEQFENIIVRATPEGRLVRIKDIARVELGSKNSDITTSVSGLPSASIGVFQLPDANALSTAKIVKEKMAELSLQFPKGMQYEIRYDTTPFISESINEVFKTLREAVLLVAVVVLLFLQNWRSALIPLIAVPVAIIGTFAVMAAMGFTLNNLTLFGLVLAIGIVVDDAIVVVESVEHHIEHGLAPYDATVRAMQEVSGPVVAIALVLTAVFVPCAFITGIVGQFFRQFALTIAVSTVISAFNSLTLSPALAALLLKPKVPGAARTALPRVAYAGIGGILGYLLLTPRLIPYVNQALQASGRPAVTESSVWWSAVVGASAVGLLAGWIVGRPIDWTLSGFFALFNTGFRTATAGYRRAIGGLLRVGGLVLVLYGGLIYLTYFAFTQAPAGFIPSQDMGYLLINAQMPDSTSAERSLEILNRMELIARKTPGIKYTQLIAGQSFMLSANGPNFGSMFVILDTFENRRYPIPGKVPKMIDGKPVMKDGKPVMEDGLIHLDSTSISNSLRAQFTAQIPDAMLMVLGPPPVRGVGRAGGFKIMIEDRGDLGSATLQEQTDNIVEKSKDDPRLVGLATVFRANVPSLTVTVDRTEALIRKVPLRDLYDTLRIYMGSLYVNDFNRFGRTWQVIVQADSKFRNQVEDVQRLKVRNAQGMMVPLGAVASVNEVNGPLVLTRYNMYPAAAINGAAAPGISSGEAIDIMEELANDQLLRSMSFEWSELAYLELQAGNTAMIVFAFAVVMVFLVLAAQYESWSLPLAIILVVPMCLLSGVVGVLIAKEDINVFTQIGFVVLVGLASKNAILIVEFAKMRREQGDTAREATLEACSLRLRPIVMTSLAFILGVLPLLVSHGAGAEMRRTLGTTVFSGMIGVTVFGIFLTPVFFYMIDRLGGTTVFRSANTRRAARYVLYALTLGIIPLMHVLGDALHAGGRRLVSGRPKPPLPPPTDNLE
jgi:multidrug efflux pump